MTEKTPSDLRRRAANVDSDDVSDLAVRLGRIGIASQGVLYVLLGWVTAQIALGGGGGEASGQGALSELSRQPFGVVLLVLIAAGFALYAVWQAFEALGKGMSEPTRKNRARGAVKTVVGVALTITTITVIVGGGGGEGQQAQEATSTVLDWPGGRWLVGLAGLVTVAVAVYLAWSGIAGRIREKLVPGVPDWQVRLGQVGNVARGLAFATVGVLLVTAAWQYDPSEAGGVDAALNELRSQPFGTVIVLAVALGFAAWGAFCLLTFRRHRQG